MSLDDYPHVARLVELHDLDKQAFREMCDQAAAERERVDLPGLPDEPDSGSDGPVVA